MRIGRIDEIERVVGWRRGLSESARAGHTRSSVAAFVAAPLRSRHRLREALPRGYFTLPIILTLLLVGCHKQERIVPVNIMPAAVHTQVPLPTYTDLIKRYNRNIESLDQLWAATNVKLRWRDEDGDDRFEEGDGKFLYVRPRRTALTVGKLGKTYLWAGSDQERFWLFDRQEDVAYVGSFKNVGRPCARPLPLAINPSQVPYLLGLMPINPYDVPTAPAVERVGGYFLVEPPGLGLRMLLDPETARPVRVDLIDNQGRSVVVSRLKEDVPVRMGDAKPQAAGGAVTPMIASRADVYVVNQAAHMTLELSRISDGRAKHRIQERVFNFDVLTEALEPKKIVNLDGGCE